MTWRMRKGNTKEIIEWKNIRLVPILHNRMEFALEVRRVFREIDHEFPFHRYIKPLPGAEEYKRRFKLD